MGRRSNRHKIWKALARERGAQADAAQLMVQGEITATLMKGEPDLLGHPTAPMVLSRTGRWYKRHLDGSLRRVI